MLDRGSAVSFYSSKSISIIIFLSMDSFAFSFLFLLSPSVGHFLFQISCFCERNHIFHWFCYSFFFCCCFFPSNWGAQFSNFFVIKFGKVSCSRFIQCFNNFTEVFCNEKTWQKLLLLPHRLVKFLRRVGPLVGPGIN